MELTDHQTHLKSVTEQANGLINEIQGLETQAKIITIFQKLKRE